MVIGGVLAATSALGVTGASAATPIERWTQVGHQTRVAITSDEGVATVRAPGAAARRYYTGVASVPADLFLQGWNHIGDPDSAAGYVVDAIQTSGNVAATAHAKLFRVTRPDGGHVDYVHQDVAGEATNNSWAAISPDRRWMLSGEYGTMTRFLVFPTPLLNAATPAGGGALPLAATVTLDRPVTNVQGCDFRTPTRLLCSADDAAKDLLQVDLAAPLTGQNVTGRVTTLGPLPQHSLCSGTYEAEGLDYDGPTGDLRVVVNPPPLCGDGVTDVYTFRESQTAQVRRR